VHRRKLQNAPPPLKSICSDTAFKNLMDGFREYKE
jgi:hypothetical protein